MKIKEYLGQAYRIDHRINSKLEQISSLHDLATKATSTISDMPGSATRNIHRMEDIIVKIMDLEEEVNKDIDAVSMKSTAEIKIPSGVTAVHGSGFVTSMLQSIHSVSSVTPKEFWFRQRRSITSYR